MLYLKENKMCRDDNNLYWLNDVMHYKSVVEFFVKFSRFEYALKKNGYYIANNKGIIKETNFNKFTKQYKNIDLPKELKDFLTYLDKEPVGKLKTSGDYLRIKENSKSDLVRLVSYLRRIRNNLFHGVKYPNLGKYENDGRGEHLINLGIKTIDFLVTINDEIKITYKG